jgi:methionyl-tRNA formyltransferase
MFRKFSQWDYKMRVIYLGKGAQSSKGLCYLLNKGIDVVAVVAPEGDYLFRTAFKNNLTITSDNKLYEELGKKQMLKDVDLVISFGFWKRIKLPLIQLAKIGCINFHPAPLPEFRGMGGVYNFAIYENIKVWGVSAHFVDENFDTGDIIKVHKFKIKPENETAFSLRQKSHIALLKLFKEVIDLVYETGVLPRLPQGQGRYISRNDFENLRIVTYKDTLQDIERKIRAFWCPPYNGAYIEVQGKEFTLVNDKLLKEIGTKYSTQV